VADFFEMEPKLKTEMDVEACSFSDVDLNTSEPQQSLVSTDGTGRRFFCNDEC
jgi:hypothetical protein